MAKAQPETARPAKRRSRGFQAAGHLLQDRLKTPAGKRGFADVRVLTHWADIVGADMARMARPVRMTYGDGMGGTLVVLSTGANALLVEMAKTRILERVNATYGYRAVARVKVTQTAATGFAEGQAVFEAAKPKPRELPSAATVTHAAPTLREIENPELRQALTRLAQNVLTPRQK